MATARGAWPLLQRYQGLLGLILLVLVAAALEPKFLTLRNLQSVLDQAAVPGIMAVGMTFVIVTGGIDLSVGSLIGLLNCVAATWLKDGASLGTTIAYVLFLGTAIGALLGWIISVTRLQPFVVTLAAMVALRGIAYVYTNNAIVSGFRGSTDALQRTYAGLPFAIWLLLAVVLIASITMHKTRFGRHVYAVGGNEEAARLSALPVTKTKTAAYAINGFCIALAAIMLTARGSSGSPEAGVGYELEAIAAAVVGGSSLLGGYGSPVGTFAGVLFMGSLSVLFILRGINDKVAMIWKGGIVLLAVYLQHVGRRKG